MKNVLIAVLWMLILTVSYFALRPHAIRSSPQPPTRTGTNAATASVQRPHLKLNAYNPADHWAGL